MLYLSYFFYRYAGLLLLDLGAGLEPLTQSYPELAFAAGLLACTVVLVVRPRSRNSAMAATLAVAVLIAGTAAVFIGKPFTASMAEILLQLLVLAALAVLSRGSERLPRFWLRLPGLVVAVTLLAPVATAVRIPDYFTLLRAPTYIWAISAVLAFAWIVIDARPAIGVAIFFGLTASDRLISSWQAFSLPRSELPAAARELLLAGAWSIAWKLLVAALLLGVLSSPRLRRQTEL